MVSKLEILQNLSSRSMLIYSPVSIANLVLDNLNLVMYLTYEQGSLLR